MRTEFDQMNRWKVILLALLKPKGYNLPPNFIFLYNQWLHQGFLWKFWSYEFCSKHSKDPR